MPAHAPWYSWTISSPSPVARHDRTDSSTDPVSSRSSPSLDLHHATAHAPSSCASAWCARGESFIAEASAGERARRAAIGSAAEAPNCVNEPRAIFFSSGKRRDNDVDRSVRRCRRIKAGASRERRASTGIVADAPDAVTEPLRTHTSVGPVGPVTRVRRPPRTGAPARDAISRRRRLRA